MPIEVLALASAVSTVAGSISTAITAGKDMSDLLPRFAKLGELDAAIQRPRTEVSTKVHWVG